MNTQSSTTSSLGEVARANRIPLALIGLGAAWLVVGNTGLAERVANDERVQSMRRRAGEIANDIGFGSTAGQSDRTGPPGQILGPDGEPLARTGGENRTDGWIHQAAGAARGAIGTVRDAGSTALDRAGGYAGNAGDLAKRAGDQVAGKLQSDPWLIGIVGLVAGALAAAILPPTSVEQEYVSAARDQVWNQAAELGHDAAGRVRELADSTVRAGKQ